MSEEKELLGPLRREGRNWTTRAVKADEFDLSAVARVRHRLPRGNRQAAEAANLFDISGPQLFEDFRGDAFFETGFEQKLFRRWRAIEG